MVKAKIASTQLMNTKFINGLFFLSWLLFINLTRIMSKQQTRSINILSRSLLKFSFHDFPILHGWNSYLFDFTLLQVNQNEKDVQVMTFGQPRVGNAAFASLYSTLVPNTIRVTHEHDIVPHLPPYYYYLPQKTYHHFPREVRHDGLMGWWNLYIYIKSVIFSSN